MNITVYIFGVFEDGYTQYPNDYTNDIFQKFAQNIRATTQILIHRKENLLYYGYIRKLENGHYIGFCLVVNGILFTQIEPLFSYFEKAIENLVYKGNLICFNREGEIVSCVEKLYTTQKEIKDITQFFYESSSNLERYTASLPSVNYGISKEAFKTFSINDNLQNIIQSTYTNGYTFVYKASDYNTLKLGSFRFLHANVNKEKQDVEKKLNGIINKQEAQIKQERIEFKRERELLENELSTTKRQKKQTNIVFILFAVLCVGFFKLCSLDDDLSEKKKELETTQQNLEASGQEVSRLQSRVIELVGRCTEFETIVNAIHENNPIIPISMEIKNEGETYGAMIYSRNTTYIIPQIEVFSLISGEVEFQIKFYTPYGLSTGNASITTPSGYSYSARKTLNENQKNTIELSGWGNTDKGHWAAGSYKIEIWYKDKILFAKNFTIY